jgi:hypothetical protein
VSLARIPLRIARDVHGHLATLVRVTYGVHCKDCGERTRRPFDHYVTYHQNKRRAA